MKIQLSEINELIRNDSKECVYRADEEYQGKIKDATDRLLRGRARIILLAGPSSSGKTTTAGMIRRYLQKNGSDALIISMDDFYRDKDDPSYPKDEKGMLDFEALDALRVDEIKLCLKSILAGESFCVPRYIFGEGRSVKEAERITLPHNAFLIMEGLHALNPVFTEGLDKGAVAKIYISVSSDIYEGDRILLSGRMIRFIRRMTRDSIYRATDVFSTLQRWESVTKGEDRNLYPYKDTADIKLNTFHLYELGLLKPLAQKAINASPRALEGEYINGIISALEKVEPLDRELLSQNSLMKEFVL